MTSDSFCPAKESSLLGNATRRCPAARREAVPLPSLFEEVQIRDFTQGLSGHLTETRAALSDERGSGNSTATVGCVRRGAWLTAARDRKVTECSSTEVALRRAASMLRRQRRAGDSQLRGFFSIKTPQLMIKAITLNN